MAGVLTVMVLLSLAACGAETLPADSASTPELTAGLFANEYVEILKAGAIYTST